jgi:hypothetical protein
MQKILHGKKWLATVTWQVILLVETGRTASVSVVSNFHSPLSTQRVIYLDLKTQTQFSSHTRVRVSKFTTNSERETNSNGWI